MKRANLRPGSVALGARASLLALALVLGLGLGAAVASAKAPPAGATIGNQATATYTDSSGVQHSTTSNVVYTKVSQVAAVELEAPVTAKPAATGGQVSYPLVLTNNGNGTDAYSLAVSGASATVFVGTPLVYLDVDGDGIPDGAAISAPISVAPGSSVHLVVVGQISGSAGSSDAFDVTATSGFDGTKTSTVTLTATVQRGPILDVTKSVSPHSDGTAGPYTYTIHYTNNGDSQANLFTITDIIPTGLAFVPNSAKWNGLPAASTPGITFSCPASTVTATIAVVPTGAQEGELTFQVTVVPGTPAAVLENVASYSYTDGATPTTGKTNSAPFEVVAKPNASLVSPPAIETAPQGSTVSFHNTLTNRGNLTDTFDITTQELAGHAFPVGTLFALYDGATGMPLLDTNSNSIADSGPMAPGSALDVVLKVLLPPAAYGPVSPQTDYQVLKTATSAADPSVYRTATDELLQIVAATVDMTADNSGTTVGSGPGPEVPPAVTTHTTTSGQADFALRVSNGAPSTDTYVLQASTDSSFGTVGLPLGWTCVFYDAAGSMVVDTGLVAGGSTKSITARITTPDGTIASTTQVYFRASSPTTGSTDRLHASVVVDQYREISMPPSSHPGEVYPGGSTVFAHTITNEGNVREGDPAVTPVPLTLGNSDVNFTSSVYWDKNGNGYLDSGDVLITGLSDITDGGLPGLAPSHSASLLVKVVAGSGVSLNTPDTCALTAIPGGSGAPASAVVRDALVVVPGDILMVKEQALDAACDGTPDAAYSAAPIVSGAVPGAGIRYRITVTNRSLEDAVGVVVTDIAPAYTAYFVGDGSTSATGLACYTLDAGATFAVTANPSAGSPNTITANLGTLTHGQTAVVYFEVKIDPVASN